MISKSEPFTINDNGEICEYSKPISNERIIMLLNEAEHDSEKLRYTQNLLENSEYSLEFFRTRTRKLSNGIKDCVAKRRDLKKFAKEMGVI